MILKKIHSQEFTDHLNSVDADIKWTTEGEVVMEAPLEGSATVGEEEMSVRVERALAFLDTWTVVQSDGSIRMKVFTLTSISISAVTICWNTKGKSGENTDEQSG